MSLTAFLIGNNSLTAECGNRWLERGHTLAAVVTRDVKVASWAAERSLRCVAPGIGLAERLAGPGVDWVLSVANLSLVPETVLSLAAQGGVNFHDGPLPGYAGLNAPVWAILNGEVSHAINWHLMTAGIDEGDILVSREFPIERDDTAFTINARCFAAGLDSFAEVISALEAGGHPRHRHPAGPRRVWRRADRPWAAGRLDFGKSATEVARTVWALDHGSYRNPVAVAKIELLGRVLAVGAAELVSGSGNPGDVLDAGSDGITVACAEGAIRLLGLRDMDGKDIDPSVMRVSHLASPDAAEAARLSAALAVAAGAEARLRGLLLTMDPVSIGAVSDEAADWQSVALPDEPMARLALAAMRACGRVQGDIAYSNGEETAPRYVLPWVPVRLAALKSVRDAEALAERAFEAARADGGVAADIALREPDLSSLVPSALAISSGQKPVEGAVVTLAFGQAPMLWYDAQRLPAARAEALAQRIARIAAEMRKHPDAELAGIGSLSEVEQRQFSGALAATRRPYDHTMTVPAAILAQAARTPDAVAVVSGDIKVNYAELVAGAGRIANTLRSMGIVRGALVGLACTRGVELVTGALGIQLAGAAYVPMDPAYPADRLSLYAEDSGCAVIVTQASVLPNLPSGPAYLAIDTDKRVQAAATTAPENGPEAEDPAYVIYTSGSTGRPKAWSSAIAT